MFPEFPARPLALTLPLAVYEALAALGGEEEAPEEVAARLLAEAVAHGSPADLRATLDLMYQVAEQLEAEMKALRQRFGEG